jgi:AbrB family looped-hinge helix DNA binding protein
MQSNVLVRGQSTVSVRGQTVIPREIREALGIKTGTKLHWFVKEGKLQVFPIPEDPVRALRGILKGHGTFEDFMRERNEERKRELEKEEEEERVWRATSSTPQP